MRAVQRSDGPLTTVSITVDGLDWYDPTEYAFAGEPSGEPRGGRATYSNGLVLELGGPEWISVGDAKVQAYNLTIQGTVYHLDGRMLRVRQEHPCAYGSAPGTVCPDFEIALWSTRGQPAPSGVGLLKTLADDGAHELLPSHIGGLTRVSYEPGPALPPIPALGGVSRESGTPQALFPGSDKPLFEGGTTPDLALAGLRSASPQADAALAGGGCVGSFRVETPSLPPAQLPLTHYTATQGFEANVLPAGGAGSHWTWHWQRSWDTDAFGNPAGATEAFVVDSKGNVDTAPLDCRSIRSGFAASASAVDHAAQVDAMPWYQGKDRTGFYFRYLSIGGRWVPTYWSVMPGDDDMGFMYTAIQSAVGGEWSSMWLDAGGIRDGMDG
jgi:hypothetical protein